MNKRMLPTFFIALAMWTQVATASPIANPIHVIGDAEFSLNDRYSNSYVSNVFADNILLTLAYMRGIIKDNKVDWNAVKAPFTYSFTLQPGDVFAFHQDVLPQFEGKVVKTTTADFDSDQGFESDGYLVADGVCHLASLMNEAATRAGLTVVAPTNHDFAVIPEVDRKYGTAIYYMPGDTSSNQLQNLYVQNNQDKPVTFVFTYKDNALDVKVTEDSN